MESSTKNVAKSARDVAYYRQRYKNRFYEKLISWINQEAESKKLTRKDIAERLGKDPGLISRLLSQPSNLTLDSVSDILLAFDAEAEPPEIVRFSDRRAPNYVHPLMAKVMAPSSQKPVGPMPESTAKVGKLRLQENVGFAST